MKRSDILFLIWLVCIVVVPGLFDDPETRSNAFWIVLIYPMVFLMFPEILARMGELH